MRRGAQSFPFWLLIFAPIRERGSIMRRMGRLQMEASPVSVTEKSCAAKMPEISLVVVPLFPASSICVGAVRPCSPLPCTRISFPLFSIEIPIFSKQDIVERQSAPCRKCVSLVVPSERAPNITPRWLMDLSPGTVISPCNLFAF